MVTIHSVCIVTLTAFYVCMSFVLVSHVSNVLEPKYTAFVTLTLFGHFAFVLVPICYRWTIARKLINKGKIVEGVPTTFAFDFGRVVEIRQVAIIFDVSPEYLG